MASSPSRSAAIVCAAALLAIALACAGSGNAAPRTQIVRWSPFDSSGAVKSSLHIKTLRGTCDDWGYTFTGNIAYRCSSGHWLFDNCFRDGPAADTDALCVDRPWARTAVRIHDPYLVLRTGITFGAPRTDPWGLVLEHGHRCEIIQGAHGALTYRGRRYIVDYACEDGLAVLREGMTRGAVWHVKISRARGSSHGPVETSAVTRVYFGVLPPPMARQSRLAYAASQVASPGRTPYLVRMSLPQSDWAYVIDVVGSAYKYALLHRVGDRWRLVRTQGACAVVPRRALNQLFYSARPTIPYPQGWGPQPGEITCP